MRIPIAWQLALLVLFTSMVVLTVISIATWENNYKFVIGVKSQGLALTASLKAGQVASDLALIEASCQTIVTRTLIQYALQRFYKGNNTIENWSAAIQDAESALGNGGYSPLYQTIIFPRNGAVNPHGILNVTGQNVPEIALPYTFPNGSNVMLGHDGVGYPPSLYPNLTYTMATDVSNPLNATSEQTEVNAFPDFLFNTTSALLLGPLEINSTFSLLSITLPIINNTSNTDILGFMTIVASAAQLQHTVTSTQGLDTTGLVLLLRPATADNLIPSEAQPAILASNVTDTSALQTTQVQYVFQPGQIGGQADRHSGYRQDTDSFALSSYPAVLQHLTGRNSGTKNATTNLDTTDEQGWNVAVGVATPQTTLVDWVLVVEETHNEAVAPVGQLRKIILACVFATAGFIGLLVVPMAHYSVTPIRRLKSATEKSIQPPQPFGSEYSETIQETLAEEDMIQDFNPRSEKSAGIVTRVADAWRGTWGGNQVTDNNDRHRKAFKVPGKVRERKHFITDELTELTGTFNEMADELMIQYTRLEERVAERTRELETAKKAAETANESKTLFIANISHELKTPLNGILGMCAVCMGDDDLPRIHKSLQVLYKSGDLLLHLLNDLLTFSKNEIDQAIRLDEKEFCLADIKSQIVTIFEKQVQEKRIHFSVDFVNSPPPVAQVHGEIMSDKQPIVTVRNAMGPPGTGRLKDMILWGDQHRILQILINLVSNSLKFTPEEGRVAVRIRCLGDEKRPDTGANVSMDSRHGSHARSQTPSFKDSKAESGPPGSGGVFDHSHLRNGWRTPPLNSRTLTFAFEVEDSGPGIPPHFQERVFEPFMQGDLGLNRKYGGTGLGLSICLQLSRLMGGTIGLESTVGKGTTFRLDIPLKYINESAPSMRSVSTGGSRPASAAISVDDSNVVRTGGNNSPALTPVETKNSQPRLVGLSQPFFAIAPPPVTNPAIGSDSKIQPLNQVPPVSDEPSKIRVLVAEDNAVNQEVVLRLLKLEDIYDVTVAKDGQEAFDTVKAAMNEGKRFDLIFMDIQMPNLDGLQSTRLIREIGYSAPIVALSALADEGNIKDCIESGMNMFLSKPIRRPALKQVLQKFATIVEEPENSESAENTATSTDSAPS